MKSLCIHSIILLFALLFSFRNQAQELTQTLRGNVVEAESKFPLTGVVITVYKDSILLNGAVSDGAGHYVVASIPVGRIKIKFELIGFSESALDNIEVSSAKELVLNIELEQSAAITQTVEITATREGRLLRDRDRHRLVPIPFDDQSHDEARRQLDRRRGGTASALQPTL